MAETAVSIIIPVYNTEKYIKRCLDSVKNQTLKDIEIIVIDDGSTDESPSICDSYKNDYRFTIIHNKNQGPSGSRNDGIVCATGEYCMFVDSDDWLELSACEKLYGFAKETGADLVIGGHVNESSAGSTERYLYSDNCVFEGAEYKKDILIHTLGLVGDKMRNPAKLDKLTPVWARLYKRSIIINGDIRFIDLKTIPSECLQFNFEFCMQAKCGAFLHDIVYHYRRNAMDSVTKPYRNDLWQKWKWWIDYEEQYLSRANAESELWKAYYSRICCSIIPLGGNAIKLRTYSDQRKECKLFLNQETLKHAFANTDFSSCPFYWKAFFICAKNEYIDAFLFLTGIMRLILKKRKA